MSERYLVRRVTEYGIYPQILDKAIKRGASHVVMVLDTFEWRGDITDDSAEYPEYLSLAPGEDPVEAAARLDGGWDRVIAIVLVENTAEAHAAADQYAVRRRSYAKPPRHWIGPRSIQLDPETKRQVRRREEIDIAHRGRDYWGV
jgi:hypothetical protein